jgi:hypothetical protein
MTIKTLLLKLPFEFLTTILPFRILICNYLISKPGKNFPKKFQMNRNYIE